MVEQGLVGKEFDVAAVVDISTDAKYFAYQLKYDSIHGRCTKPLLTEKSSPSLEDMVGDLPEHQVLGTILKI
jgi:glyceraldehyde 3-phosphate dehydrogenase